MKSATFDRWLLGAGGLVALLVAAVVLTFQNVRRLNEGGLQLVHAHEVMDALEEVLAHMRQAEAVQRTCIITGDDGQVPEITADIDAAQQGLEKVRQLTGDNPDQQVHVPDVRRRIEALAGLWSRTAKVRKEQGFEAARQVILGEQSNSAMIDLQGVLRQMHETERALLRQRSERREQVYHSAISTGLLTGVAAVGGVIAFMVLLLRHLVTRTAAAAVVAEQGERLRQQTEDLQTLLETLPVGVFIAHDPDCRKITGNRAAYELLRRLPPDNLSLTAPAEELPANFRILRNGAPVPPDRLPLQRAAKGERVRDEELNITFDDGSVIKELVSAVPLLDAGGQVRGAVGVVLDVTREREVSEALRASEERLRLFIEHAPAAIAMFGPDMRYLAASRRWLTDYNLDDQDVLGKSHYDLFPEIPSRWREIHQRGLSGEVIKADEDHFERADGRTQWLRWEVRPWRRGSGEVGGIVIFAEDISVRKEAEKAVRESETKYRTLFENMTEEVHFWQVVRDEAGQVQTWRLVDINPPALRGWGMARAEVVGKLADEIFPGATLHFMPIVQKVMSEGVPHSYETYFPGLDQYLRLTTVPLGEYFITTGADITAIKKAHLALQASEERLRLAVEATGLGIFDYHPETGQQEWSVACKAIWGLPPDAEVSPEVVLDAVHPEDRRRARELAEGSLEPDGPGAFSLEHRVVRPDGSVAWVQARGKTIFEGNNEQRRAVRSLGTMLDITARKQSEERLREAEQQFRAMADNIPQLAWMARPDGHIFWYNRRWYEYTGTTAEQMEGWGWQNVHDPQVLPSVLQRWEQSLATGEPFDMIFPLKGQDGTFRPFLTRTAPFKDAAGQVLYWFGAIQTLAIFRWHRNSCARPTAARTSSLPYWPTSCATRWRPYVLPWSCSSSWGRPSPGFNRFGR